MKIASLIGVMIAIIVGVSLIPAITESIETVKETTEVSTTMSGVLSIIPIVFVAVMILGAVAQMGSEGGIGIPSFHRSHHLKNSKELHNKLLELSSKYEYCVNNLENIFNVKTATEKIANGLYLDKNIDIDKNIIKTKLLISPKHDWYIVDKPYENQDSFVVVGLHKKDAMQNVVFELGQDAKNNVYLEQFNFKKENENEYIENITGINFSRN